MNNQDSKGITREQIENDKDFVSRTDDGSIKAERLRSYITEVERLQDELEASNANLGNELFKVKEENEELNYQLSHVVRIRCMKHVAVPSHNENEINGGECGGCIIEELNKAHQCISELYKYMINNMDLTLGIDFRLNKALTSAKSILSSHEAGEGKGKV